MACHGRLERQNHLQKKHNSTYILKLIRAVFSGPFLCRILWYLCGMKYAYLTANAIIACILFVVIFKSGCKRQESEQGQINERKYEVIKRVIDTQYVDKKITIIKKGEDIYRDTTIYKLVPYLDSSQIQDALKEYYARNVSKDTIRVDSGYVYITDTISQNAILSRIFTMDVKYPIITKETFYKEKKKVQVFIGAKGMVTQSGNFQSAGVGLMLKTKSDRMYGIGAGFDGKRNLNLTADIYIKL